MLKRGGPGAGWHRSGTLALAAGALALAFVMRLQAAPPGGEPAPARQAAPAAPQAPAPQSPGKPEAPAADTAALPAGYVGDETCLTCHESQTLQGTPHGRAAHPRTPAARQGCETCHGPGQKHSDDDDNDPTLILTFTRKTNARETNATCLSCHDRGTHALWEGSAHDARNLSCATCHSVHAYKSVTGQLTAASQDALCITCHRPQVLKTRRQAHMPLREGAMSCSSCHDPHGTTNVRLLKTGNWINESCVACHAEKRGPFLYEHAAGRESCVSCHDPHGSNHDRMLVARPPMLCQRCHIGSRHPSTIYDGAQLANASNRMLGRSCVNCHSTIHGSNHPAGGTFLR
jgi:DmsE family decaheme c-type cytochrome